VAIKVGGRHSETATGGIVLGLVAGSALVSVAMLVERLRS